MELRIAIADRSPGPILLQTKNLETESACPVPALLGDARVELEFPVASR